MIRALVICLAVLPAPGMTQPLDPADVGRLANCLDGFEGDISAARQTCSGLIERPCLDSSEGATTVGMVNCAAREELAWEALRAEVFARLEAAAQASDEYYKEQNLADYATALDSFRAADTAWATWRDLECRARADDHGNGSMRQIVAGFCRSELIRERVLTYWFR